MERSLLMHPLASLARGTLMSVLIACAPVASPVSRAASPPPVDGSWIEQLGPTSSGHRVIVDPVYDRLVVLAYPLEPDWTGSLRLAWLPLDGTPEWRLAEMTVPAGMSAWDAYHTTVYDPARHRLLVACQNPAGTATEVWAMPLEQPYSWTLLTTAGIPPSPRFAGGLALDAARDRLLLHGGLEVGGGPLNETWVLSLAGTPTWSQIVAGGPLPPVTMSPTLALDVVGDRLIVPCKPGAFSGDGELWALSLGASPAWTRLDADGDPLRPSMGSSFVVDAAQSRVLAFDGEALRVRAIPLAGGAWAEVDGMPSPERQGVSVVPDPTRGRFLVHGGGDPQFGHGPCGDTYAYSTATGWSPVLTNGIRPGRRRDAARALDPARGRLLVQGGYSTGGVQPGLWALSLADMAWTQIVTQGAALGWNAGHAAAYDPLGDRMLLTLGQSEWSTGWQIGFATSPPTVAPLAAGGTPPVSRTGAAHALDLQRHRLVVFGGYDGHDMLGDLWALDLEPSPAWHPIAVAPGPAPEARSGAMMAYDPVRGRVLLFGGYSQNGVRLDDTWALEDHSGVDTWVRIGEGEPAPEGRNDATMDYDPLLDRMLLHAGYRGSPWPDVRFGWDDTWELALSGPGGWRRLDIGGAPPRGRYGHVSAFDVARNRLVVATGTEWGANDVWTFESSPPVDAVPPAPLAPPSSLALAPLRNPCAGALDVRLAQPARGRVTLEVLDVSGRRVTSRDLGERDAGAHTVRLLEPGAAAPGLYLIRARLDSRVTTAKVLVVH